MADPEPTTMQYQTPFTQRALALSTQTSVFEDRVLKVPSRIPTKTTSTALADPSTVPLPLPVHILTRILELLDLRTLGRVRQASRGLNWAVHTQTPYQTLLHRVPDALQALSDARTLSSFSIGALDSAIRNPLCAFCGSLATLFSLAFGARICGYCLTLNVRARVIPALAVHALFDVPRCALSLLFTVHTLPTSDSSPRALVRLMDVFKLVEMYYQTEAAFKEGTERALKRRVKKYNKELARRKKANNNDENKNHDGSDLVKPLPWRAALQAIGSTPNLLVTAALPPFLSLTHGVPIPVRYCAGCMAEKVEYNSWLRDPEPVNHAQIQDAHARRASWAWMPEGLNRHVDECAGCWKLEGRGYFFLGVGHR